MKLPKALRDKLNEAQDFVRHPNVKSCAEIGTKVLAAAANIGQAKLKGPLGFAGLTAGIIDAIAQSGRKFYAEISFLTKDMVELEGKSIAHLLFQQGAFVNAEVLFKDDDYQIKALTIKDKRMLIVLNKSGKILNYYPVYIDKGFDIEDACNLLWVGISKYVVVCLKNGDYDKYLSVSPIVNMGNVEYVNGDFTPENLVQKFATYRKAGISKAFRLDGPPGTGKTTYAFRCAHTMNGSFMVITPEILGSKSITKQEIINLIHSFKPSVLLFDDVDRAPDGDMLLALMDQVRLENKDTLILSTVNDSSKLSGALKRPRRLGVKITCLAPNLEWRLKLIESHSKAIGLNRDISHLAKYMNHPLFSHDHVIDAVEQALLDSDEEVIRYIEEAILDLTDSEDKSKDSKEDRLQAIRARYASELIKQL